MPEFKVKAKTVMTQPPPPPKRQRIQKIKEEISDLEGALATLQDGEFQIKKSNAQEIVKIEEKVRVLKRNLAMISSED